MIRVLIVIAAIIASWVYLPWWGAAIVTAIALAIPIATGLPIVGLFLLGWLLLDDVTKLRQRAGESKRAEAEKKSRGY